LIPDALSFNRVLQVGAGLHLDKPLQGHEDIAFLQYTGGTTGVSKGAVLTHRNVIANILQNDAWSVPAMKDLPQGKQWVTVCALPLYHILALNACMMMGARWGALNVLIPNPRDIGGLMKTLSRFKIHFFPGVNTLFNAMLNHPDIKLLDLSELQIALVVAWRYNRLSVTAGRNLPASRFWKATVCQLLPSATLSTGMAGFSGTIGLPIPSTDRYSG
jgi:long-chain acyl-CoA synthetase